MRFIERYGLNVPRAARLMALLNVAQADAGVAAWDTKYAYWTVRPENAIRNLDMDPKWKPFIETPFFPAYVSGHAVYSGAGADVLSYLFPQDREEIQAKAREAGFSRILGGIHFRSDSVEGLKMGHKLGALVVAHARSDGADG